jgi:NAD(P)H-hydrate epimerase
MNNAGSAVYKFILDNFDVKGKSVAVLVGSGNNGGDGINIASKLKGAGVSVCVVLTNSIPRTALSAYQFEYYRNIGGEAIDFDFHSVLALRKIERADILVDAVFGTGFSGEMPINVKTALDAYNKSTAVKISVDIPSGVNADSCEVSEYSAKSDYTLTFEALKIAHTEPELQSYTGQTVVVNIGVPREAHEQIQEETTVLDDEFIKHIFKKRPRGAHKGVFGRILVLGGCRYFRGAPVLSVLASLRSGVGIASLGSTEKVVELGAHLAPEATFLPLLENQDGYISGDNKERILEEAKKCSAVVFGMGMGNTPDTKEILSFLLRNYSGNILIDADGINALSENIDILRETSATVVLTPHIAEMARLIGRDTDYVKGNMVSAARDTARKLGAVVVLKSAKTVIAMPSGDIFCNIRGCAGMAKGGSGDMLSGIIGSFLSQGYKPFDAAALGVYVHALSGEEAEKDRSNTAMLPRDMIDALGNVFLKFERQ